MPYVSRTKRRRSISKIALVITAICAAVAVVLLLLGLFAKQQEVRAANVAAAEAYTPAPVATAPPSAASAPATAAVILGDSYTAAESGGYAGRLAGLMGWDATIMGQGGTGYVNPGQAEEGDSAYPDRIPDVIAAAPEFVLVQGSTNDGDGSGLAEAADSVFSQLREGLPEATIVAVGPVAAPSIPRDKLDVARTTLAEVAAAYSVQFIDPVEEGWLSDPALYSDGVHPSFEGHSQLAELIAEALPESAQTPSD
jgi:acyl-CoA thioesterase-1